MQHEQEPTFTPPREGAPFGPNERWRYLISEANIAFAVGELARARAYYGEALAEADQLFVAATGNEPTVTSCAAPALFTIACHNLAEVARREERFDEASELVSRAFERLLAVANSTRAPLELRASCVRNLKPALAEISGDLSARRLTDRILPAADRARRAFEAVSRAIDAQPAAS